jgi:opacity protein-like surface antigen
MTSKNLTRIYTILIIVLIVTAAWPMTAGAQQKRNIDITPTASYMWGGSFDTFEGEIHLEDGMQYGVILSRDVANGVCMELSYATMSSRATFVPYYIGTPTDLDALDMKLNIHYFQLGAVHEINKGKTKPFMGFSMGAVLFHPGESTYRSPSNVSYTLEDTWRFAVSAVAGVKISLSDMVALRLQGRLFLPIYFSGGGLWVGTGGASVGLSGGIPIVQGDVGAGLAFSL